MVSAWMLEPSAAWLALGDQLLLGTLLLPLVAVLLIFLFGGPHVAIARRPSPRPGFFATGAALISFLLSVVCVLIQAKLQGGPAAPVLAISGGEWIPGFGATLGLMLDHISSVLLLLVDGIGLMVIIYSLRYMGSERDQSRFYGALLFFIAMMKLLILADNYLLLFAGWEGVGLASYLLIGYHFERWKAARAATKAFIVNRIADTGLLLAILAIGAVCGTVTFRGIHSDRISHPMLVGIALALLLGALGKSAQIPFHVWLPDAMEGPTPVSALIHSATMVCAGVYLIARSWTIFALTPEVGRGMAILGILTALLAATVALVEDDIKRVLAYSTISQIGFMFLALGVGASSAAIFHLFTHAFFKSLLFLCAGSVIHALHGNQNLKEMGGLRRRMPVTFGTMSIAAAALAGVPGLAGFFSKDQVLGAVLFAPGGTALFVVGLLTSLLTAIYAGRLIFLVFFGQPARRGSAPAHESPRLMLMPMLILSTGCIVAGYLLAPIHLGEWPLMLITGILSLSGIWLAYHYYIDRPLARQALDTRFAPLAKLLRNRWYVDAIYEEQLVDGFVLRMARGATVVDDSIIDGTVNGAAWSARQISRLSRWIDRYLIDGLVQFTSHGLRYFSSPARALQSGAVQTYAFLFIAGLLAALGYFIIRIR
jgi:NADH-quinone oxidoreductase subunit L